MDLPSLPDFFPPPPAILPIAGGLQFKDAAPMICNVVDNGVLPDDPRVMVRFNEATKIILDYLIPVGGMAIANIQKFQGLIILPPQMDNVIEAHTVGAKVFGSSDITQSFYEIINGSVYLDPDQQYDNPMIDLGLNGDPGNPSDVRRIYVYPGLDAGGIVQVTGVKRYIPVTNNDDYLIVQNIEAVKLVILSIERNENSAPDEALKYRNQAFEMLQAEVKKHLMDPRNYMFRKTGYYEDLQTFHPNTLGWIRAQIALDLKDALKTGKRNLTWAINQAEKRIMQGGIFKDTIAQIQANVVGGIVYFPPNVQSVLAVDLEGQPIPIRSEFFEHLENGPGMFTAHEFLKDMGDEYFPGTKTTRRKYKLTADCECRQCLNAVCKLRWIEKKPEDQMTIKNYEALRLMMVAKFLEEKEDWQNVQMNQTAAYGILQNELKEYLSGIRHTVHIQAEGFGLSDVGNYWTL